MAMSVSPLQLTRHAPKKNTLQKKCTLHKKMCSPAKRIKQKYPIGEKESPLPLVSHAALVFWSSSSECQGDMARIEVTLLSGAVYEL
jgi:hypothetical protein